MRGCIRGLQYQAYKTAPIRFDPGLSIAKVVRGFHVVSGQYQDTKASNFPTRHDKLKTIISDLYPRIQVDNHAISCPDFNRHYRDTAHPLPSQPESEQAYAVEYTVYGRVGSIRTAGSKLVFFDINGDGVKVQGVCNQRLLDGVNVDQFKNHFQTIQRGDIVKLTGKMCVTSSKLPSINLNRLPEIVSPCLHPLPTNLQDPEVIVGQRHVGFLASDKAASFIRAKSKIVQGMRQFLLNDDHTEVQTPIIADGAGGAVARPFHTRATEFMHRELALRIAPELWLKRLVVGGFDRVFEIGPSFRNEGIDLTHNPEFTTCEFYRAYTDLKGLMSMTERMFGEIDRSFHPNDFSRQWSQAYKTIDFIPAIEQALKSKLPDLTQSSALEDVKSLVTQLSLPIELKDGMNLPQILDKLASEYLESLCIEPTFIINHPECMSPLAKSFHHPEIPNQRVAARAELFIGGQEIANMYEEENSPIEQRRKFNQQLRFKDENDCAVDEAYLEALEWGLPPVGGWGCGIERLTMAMTGATRISDVLTFGTLKNVVSKHQRR